MAAGDIIAVSISADGWSAYVTIEGWAGKQGLITYDFGDILGGSPAMAFTVTSEGYNASGVLGTVQRTVYGTKAVRLPYPNEASLDEVDSGADLVVRVALSDEVYNDDKNGGAGTSGVDPTVDVVLGWANDGTNDSAAAAALAVTNNSTLDYPKVIGQWDWDRLRGGWRRVEADFNIGFRARHGFGVAAVQLSAIGATSAHNQNSILTTPSSKQAAGSGLFHESFAMVVPIAGYTQGEQIDLRAIAYPVVGDADSIMDTNDTTAETSRIYGNTTCYLICDKTSALKLYAVVNADTGNDGTGVVNADAATARATPFATIAAAYAAGATVVYVANSTAVPDILGSAPATTVVGYYVEVTEDPTDPGVVIDRTGAFTNYALDFLCYTNIGISYSSGNGWLNGDNGIRQVLFDACVFATSAKPSVGLGYRSNGCWFLNCTGMGGDDYEAFGTSRVVYAFTGCNFVDAVNTSLICAIANIGNTSVVGFTDGAPGNPGNTGVNKMMEHNAFFGVVAAGGAPVPIEAAVTMNVSNVSIVGNIIEIESITTSNPANWIGGDSSLFTISNLIYSHNTIVGERCNLFYNDDGTVAITRDRVFVVGNALRSYNIKSDTFASQPDGNRVGNWAQEYGVNYKSNRFDGAASSSFVGEFIGLDGAFVGNISTFGELNFTTDASSDGTGLGGGDYTPTAAGNLDAITLLAKNARRDSAGLLFGSQVGALALPSENPGIRQECFDPTGTLYADGTLMKYAVFADVAGLQAGAVLAQGQVAVAGGAGEIEIDSDGVTISSNHVVAAVDPMNRGALDVLVPGIDLGA